MPIAAPIADSLPLGQRQRLLLRLLRLRSGKQLRRILGRLHPADVAPLFPLLKPDEQSRLLDVLFEMRLAGSTLRELDPTILRTVVSDLPDTRLAVILGRLPADDAVDLLDELDPERRQALLDSLDSALAARLNNLMVYGSSTAGGMMDPDVIFFRADQTVSHTLEVLRELAQNRRLFYLYVTDDRGHLVGLVKLWQLLTARQDQQLRDVMSREAISVQADTPQEEVARFFARYDLPIVPVLNDDGRLVGIITVDDVIDVIEEEASEDLYRLGGLPRPESLGTPLGRSLRLRLPTLGLSLLGACLAAWIIGAYQELLAKYAILVAFMHIIGATGGHTARQSLTVLVASLTTGEMNLHRTWRVVFGQSLVGLSSGLLTGLLLAAVAFSVDRNGWLAGIVLVAQTSNQLVVALVATITPLLLRRLGLDPTLGSSALVVTVADVFGFATFLALATSLAQRLS